MIKFIYIFGHYIKKGEQYEYLERYQSGKDKK